MIKSKIIYCLDLETLTGIISCNSAALVFCLTIRAKQVLFYNKIRINGKDLACKINQATTPGGLGYCQFWDCGSVCWCSNGMWGLCVGSFFVV